MSLKLTNNASSTLASSITSVATSLSIQAADTGKFPLLGEGQWHPLTIVDSANNMEIVKVTARDGGLLTIVRAQEGTTAKEFSAGSRVDMRLTAGTVESLQSRHSDLVARVDNVSQSLDSLSSSTTDALNSIGTTLNQLGTITGRDLTISPNAPSGGSNGDIWLKI